MTSVAETEKMNSLSEQNRIKAKRLKLSADSRIAYIGNAIGVGVSALTFFLCVSNTGNVPDFLRPAFALCTIASGITVPIWAILGVGNAKRSEESLYKAQKTIH